MGNPDFTLDGKAVKKVATRISEEEIQGEIPKQVSVG